MPRPSDTFKPGLVRVIISTKMAVMLAMVPSAFPMALGGSSSSGGGGVRAAVDMCQSGREFDRLKLLCGIAFCDGGDGGDGGNGDSKPCSPSLSGGLLSTPSSFACHGSSKRRLGGEVGVCLLVLVELMGEVGVLESTEPDNEVMRAPLLKLSQSHRRSGPESPFEPPPLLQSPDAIDDGRLRFVGEREVKLLVR
ncbi:hypothetical protein FocTR4_00014892 [Fusarium oxysporum f. sp. cubense]|uniref:Uncharacterized protein n=1 Tax=Fusarium oxysporum f. sp. cubense TaxID=61366 RepID=A0A5C6SUP7_FUSOC|nr:hypothetical protein FocTR4_00014892 [Fusarium oxysporum f. sp. cubense]